jgi:hypothetical protein
VTRRAEVADVLVDLYTNGWCPMMACALCSLDPRLQIVETDDDGDTYHVAALDPDGRVWDVTGALSAAEFEAKWGEFWPLINIDTEHQMIAEGRWEDLARYMTSGHPVIGEPPPIAWEVTVELARNVLATRRGVIP